MACCFKPTVGDDDRPGSIAGKYAEDKAPAGHVKYRISFASFSTAPSCLPARSIAVARRGPNGLKIEKETTHVIVRWTRVASMA